MRDRQTQRHTERQTDTQHTIERKNRESRKYPSQRQSFGAGV